MRGTRKILLGRCEKIGETCPVTILGWEAEGKKHGFAENGRNYARVSPLVPYTCESAERKNDEKIVK